MELRIQNPSWINFPFQEALQKSKALHLQVQTATFQKLVSDLDQDTEALTKWVEAEKKRKSSWQGMVLTHTRKRYVRGLDNVRRFAGDNLRMVQGPLTSAEMELAEFRSSLEWTADRKRLPDQRWGFFLVYLCSFCSLILTCVSTFSFSLEGLCSWSLT